MVDPRRRDGWPFDHLKISRSRGYVSARGPRGSDAPSTYRSRAHALHHERAAPRARGRPRERARQAEFSREAAPGQGRRARFGPSHGAAPSGAAVSLGARAARCGRGTSVDRDARASGTISDNDMRTPPPPLPALAVTRSRSASDAFQAVTAAVHSGLANSAGLLRVRARRRRGVPRCSPGSSRCSTGSSGSV